MLNCDDAISLTSSDPAASALLGYAQEEQEMFEGEEVETEPSQSSCPAYKKLLEVMDRATARLDLPWERIKMAALRGRLDEWYLSGHNPPSLTSRLNGKAYAAAGQAVASLHTKAVLQVNQVDLLKDLDKGQRLVS